MLKKVFIVAVGVLIILGGLFYFFVYTTQGSKVVVQSILASRVPSEEFSFKELEGNLRNGLSLKNITLENLEYFPVGTQLKIQNLDADLTSFSLNGLTVNLQNVRLLLPEVDPIIASGSLADGVLDFNIYSKAVSLTQIKGLIPSSSLLSSLSGSIDSMDIFIKGSVDRPKLTGDIVVNKLNYDDFRLENAPVQLDLTFSDVGKNLNVSGIVNAQSGLIYSKRTKVKILKGKVQFAGNPKEPFFDFEGESRIEKTVISIVLKGTMEKPDLHLSSEPPYSREKLMVMLATGQSWKGFEQLAAGNPVSSVELSKDFLNYFIFSGHKSGFAQKFGLQDFTLSFEKDKRVVGAKKGVTDNLTVGYGVEQEIQEDKNSVFTQKVTGEYQLNKKVSVGVEKEIKERDNTIGETNKLDVPDDKVFMKFKTKF